LSTSDVWVVVNSRERGEEMAAPGNTDGDFKKKLGEAFRKRFGVSLTTEFNLCSMAYVSFVKGGKLTKERKAWLKAYEDGYLDAMNQFQDR